MKKCVGATNHDCHGIIGVEFSLDEDPHGEGGAEMSEESIYGGDLDPISTNLNMRDNCPEALGGKDGIKIPPIFPSPFVQHLSDCSTRVQCRALMRDGKCDRLESLGLTPEYIVKLITQLTGKCSYRVKATPEGFELLRSEVSGKFIRNGRLIFTRCLLLKNPVDFDNA